ncbi:MAG: M1 family metallopeptidase [Rhodothalassiaceae bacterium]
MRVATFFGKGLALAGLLLAACGQAPDRTGETIPTGQLGDDLQPLAYVVDLRILPDQPRFSGHVKIDVDIRKPSRTLYLHGIDLSMSEAWVVSDGGRIEARWEQVDPTGVARLSLATSPKAGPAELHFIYDAPFNAALEGLYTVSDGGEDYAFTQFEATSARFAFPSFDEPVFKTPFTISVTAREGHAVITTTPEISTEPEGEGLVKHHFETTPPLPTYLIAFAVGPLDVVAWEDLPPTEVRDRPLPLRGVATRGKGKDLSYALENSRVIIEALESYFDVAFPYPKLDIIAVPDFAAGAMENVGAITYREQLLLINENSSLGQKRAYASVHAHELAHQWFGNLVTPKWWDDIWLNESFATWMGNKAVDAAFPGQAFSTATFRGALRVMEADSLASARQIREPIRSNHDIATAFDGITYQKGGAVLAMFESWLGEEAFRNGVRLHMQRFANGVADVNDFLTSLAEGSGRPEVVEAFRSFLFQPGVPLVTASLSCKDAGATLSLAQERYLPLGSTGSRTHGWRIPVCYAHDKNGERERACTLLTEAASERTLASAECPAWFMPNADGAGYYRFALDDAGWSGLLGHIDALNEREAQATLGSLSAAFKAGRISAATMFEAFRILAASPDREVATAPIDDLALMKERLLTADAPREALARLVRTLYGDRLAALGLEAKPGESTDAALLRTTLVSALVDLGGDAALRETLAGKAHLYVAGEEPDRKALNPALVGIALRVAVEDGDADFARALLEKALASRDGTFRGQALGALASAPQAEIGAMMRAHIADPALRDNEAIQVAFTQVGNEAQRDALWAWVRDEANLEALLARIPTWRKGAIVNIGGGFCSEDKAAELEAFFRDRVDALEGGPRELDQTLESIRLCAALKAAKAEELRAYLAAL